jgi:hypothetical protein
MREGSFKASGHMIFDCSFPATDQSTDQSTGEVAREIKEGREIITQRLPDGGVRITSEWTPDDV